MYLGFKNRVEVLANKIFICAIVLLCTSSVVAGYCVNRQKFKNFVCCLKNENLAHESCSQSGNDGLIH